MAQREEETDAQWPLPVCHQLAGRIVDRGDVIRVERVAQSQRIRGDPESEPERARVSEAEVPRDDEQQKDSEPQHVQPGDSCDEPAYAAPFGWREAMLETLPAAGALHVDVRQSSSAMAPALTATSRSRASPRAHNV